jgi:hypothetical protein
MPPAPICSFSHHPRIAATAAAGVSPSAWGVAPTVTPACTCRFISPTRFMKNSSRFAREDRQELHALQQRHPLVRRLRQHAPVELQPRHLPESRLKEPRLRRRKHSLNLDLVHARL